MIKITNNNSNRDYYIIDFINNFLFIIQKKIIRKKYV